MTTLLRLTRGGEATVYAALTLIGLAAAVVGSRYGLVSGNGRVGPGMVPTVSGAALGFLGAILLGRAIREHAHATVDAEPEPETPDLQGRTHRERVRHLWVVFGLLLLAILAVGYIGFLAAFGALVLVVSIWVERRNMLSSLVITVGACAVIYLVFVQLLRVPLPQGLLGL